MKSFPSHGDQLVALRRIEGQVRGIQKMIEENRYCVDIITQLDSAQGALARVQDSIFEKHLNSCVTSALKGKSDLEKQQKIQEVVQLLRKFRKGAGGI
jgi:DNA-binding FrmR family transcriptional regulator